MLPEAHEDEAYEGQDGVAERIEELRNRGVAPLVRIVTFGGPGQRPGLDAEAVAGFCAMLFGLRPATRLLDGYRYEFDDERIQLGQNARSLPVREWDVEDYVRREARRDGPAAGRCAGLDRSGEADP